MIRAQIQFTEEQHRRLKRWAVREGVSVAEIVRRCIDHKIHQETTKDRDTMVREALEIMGKYRDREGKTDVSIRHDDYLDEIYGS